MCIVNASAPSILRQYPQWHKKHKNTHTQQQLVSYIQVAESTVNRRYNQQIFCMVDKKKISCHNMPFNFIHTNFQLISMKIKMEIYKVSSNDFVFCK